MSSMTGAEQARDHEYLGETIRIATINVADGGGPFGALVVRGRTVLAAGVNRVVPDLDPTAHAEVVAIRAACRAAREFTLHDSTLYASCEPCPLCLAAAMWARVGRVVYCATRNDAAAAGFDDLRWYEELARPPEQRELPVVHVGSPAATVPFRAWESRRNRRPY